MTVLVGRRPDIARAGGAAAAAALVSCLAACGSAGSQDPADGGSEVSVYLTEPVALAPPAAVTESEGMEIANAVYSPLVRFDMGSGEARFGPAEPDTVAEDVVTSDNTRYTITLKGGWTFHDGTPVTAQSYADAWNHGAYGPNGAAGAYFFADIAGYPDLQCQDPDPADDDDCPVPPSTTELSGLRVVDETTLEVTLARPNGLFALYLGTAPFNPLPRAFFEDPEAFAESPLGNGPFRVDGDGWRHDAGIRVVRYEDYPGTRPRVDAIDYRIYADVDTGYIDLVAGNLDVMGSIPASRLAEARERFPTFVSQETGVMQYLGFPLFDDRFADPRVRQAFLLALDRRAIAEAVRPDFAPMRGFVPAVIPGAIQDDCGGYCPPAGDPERARDLLAQAGGWEGPLTLWFNAGGGHDEWIEAVANQLRENLGIEDITFEAVQQVDYIGILASQEYDGPFRMGWSPDYPSPNTYLESLYGSDSGSNYTGFADARFDDLLVTARGATSTQDGQAAFQQAQRVLAETLPVMPMFVRRTTAAANPGVSGVAYDFQENLDVFRLTVDGA